MHLIMGESCLIMSEKKSVITVYHRMKYLFNLYIHVFCMYVCGKTNIDIYVHAHTLHSRNGWFNLHVIWGGRTSRICRFRSKVFNSPGLGARSAVRKSIAIKRLPGTLCAANVTSRFSNMEIANFQLKPANLWNGGWHPADLGFDFWGVALLHDWKP